MNTSSSTCPSRFQLPDLRFKEPQTTLLPAVQERPVGITAASTAESTRALADGVDRRLGGFVDVRVRDAAETLLTAPDDERPLLAAWDPGRDASLKGAMRTAMLRWHPDKFEQAFGTRLTQDTGECERILGRVRGIMQRLVEAKERWDALYRHPQYGCPKCNTL